MNPLAFLFANPLVLLGVAIAIFAAGAGTAWTVQGFRLDAAKAATEVCNTKLTVLDGQIETQNAAVLDWQKKASAAKAKSAQAVKQAQEIGRAHVALIASLDAKIAKPEGRSCTDALKVLREGK